MEDLLPMSVKSTEFRLQRRMENGLRVKGTGVGQRVKGKESERTMKARYVCLLLASHILERVSSEGVMNRLEGFSSANLGKIGWRNAGKR